MVPKSPTVFKSFVQGGFECSTHRRRDGRRLDIISSTRHDVLALDDYRRLNDLGIWTVRDGVRWHLIERQPNRYDFWSLIPMLRAAEISGTQVIWDLFHYGWPDGLDVFSKEFVERFGRFASAFAHALKRETQGPAFICPVNEISFTSWAGGEVEYLNPFARQRGFELKTQLVRATIAAIEAIREAVAAADLHIYPVPGQTELRAAIGRYLDVSPDQIVCGQGADDLIDILMRLMRPRRMVTAVPTFGMYSFLAKINGTGVVEIPRQEDFSVDLPAVAEAVIDGETLIFLCSPNNPTGNTLSEAEIAALCGLDALVVVDEAYAEFSAVTCVPLIEHYPNLVVLRTFSKWAALAGLRVGYSVSHPSLAERMMAIKQPYNVNVAGDIAARTALANRGEIFETVSCLVAERERMTQAAAALGWLEPFPSESNFVLFRVKGRPAKEVAAELRSRGVLIRYYDRPELEGYIRISAGRPEDTDRLVAALKEVGAL